MFMQLMHCGRIAPSAQSAGGRARAGDRRQLLPQGEMYTDAEGMKPNRHARAHERSRHQGSDRGICAMPRGTRWRPDSTASSCTAPTVTCSSNSSARTRISAPIITAARIENRARFVLEVVEAVITAIGKNKVGIRLSPYGVFNDMPLYDAMVADYTYLGAQLNARGLLYIHLVDHSARVRRRCPMPSRKCSAILQGRPHPLRRLRCRARRGRPGSAQGDLIAVGRPFLANPDLVARWNRVLRSMRRT